MTAKTASLVLAAAALLAAWRTHLPHEDTVTSASLHVVSLAPVLVFFGLMSIWLSDYLGIFIGPIFRGGYVDSPTPTLAFVVFGYVLLSLPLSAFLYHALRHGTQTI